MLLNSLSKVLELAVFEWENYVLRFEMSGMKNSKYILHKLNPWEELVVIFQGV